ncbi:MAG: hypothetical protein AB7F64_01440 [Gammaproteobacteria bacterium]
MQRIYAQIVHVIVSKLLKSNSSNESIQTLSSKLVDYFDKHPNDGQFNFSIDKDGNVGPSVGQDSATTNYFIVLIDEDSVSFHYTLAQSKYTSEKIQLSAIAQTEVSKENVLKKSLRLSLKRRLELSLREFEKELAEFKKDDSSYFSKEEDNSIYGDLLEIVDGFLDLPMFFSQIETNESSDYLHRASGEIAVENDGQRDPAFDSGNIISDQEDDEADQKNAVREKILNQNISIEKIDTVVEKLIQNLRPNLLYLIRGYLQHIAMIKIEADYQLELIDKESSEYRMLFDLKNRLLSRLDDYQPRTISREMLLDTMRQFLKRGEFVFPESLKLGGQKNILSSLGSIDVNEENVAVAVDEKTAVGILEVHIKYAIDVQSILQKMILETNVFLSFFGMLRNYLKNFKQKYRQYNASNPLASIKDDWIQSYEIYTEELGKSLDDFEEKTEVLFNSETKRSVFDEFHEQLIQLTNGFNAGLFPIIDPNRVVENKVVIRSLYDEHLKQKQKLTALLSARDNYLGCLQKVCLSCETDFFTSYQPIVLSQTDDALLEIIKQVGFIIIHDATRMEGEKIETDMSIVESQKAAYYRLDCHFGHILRILAQGLPREDDEDEQYRLNRTTKSDVLA